MNHELNQYQTHLYELSDRSSKYTIKSSFKTNLALSVNTFGQKEYTPKAEFFLLTSLSLMAHVTPLLHSQKVLSTGSGRKEQVYNSLSKITAVLKKRFRYTA